MTADPQATTGSRPADTRPAIVTVDDDPGVSRAVARDLRRRYGKDYRIVRAESGADALDALKEMKLRGQDVAVLLADHRMPLMDGIQFLEKAMDIYPTARRILLTAYADTDAAISAINVVDLDYYLLKPWDPPEEKFYPVIDTQIDDWRHADRKEVPQTKLIAHRWSARSSRGQGLPGPKPGAVQDVSVRRAGRCAAAERCRPRRLEAPGCDHHRR